MQCPTCGGQISDEDINQAHALAICPYCSAVHDIGEQVRQPVKVAKKGIQKGIRNRRIRIDHTPQGLVITREWLSYLTWIMIFMALFWNGIVGVIFFSFVGTGNAIFQGASCFLVGHFAVGLWLAYDGLTRLVNSTQIVISPESITISHGPIPYPGNKIIPLEHIKQFFVKRSNTTTTVNGRVYYSYNVHYDLSNTRAQVLIRGVDHVNDALFIEHEIEQYLGIDDYPVQGAITA